jgi:signal transduction histidine kinase
MSMTCENSPLAPRAPSPAQTAAAGALWPLTRGGFLVAVPTVAILYACVAGVSLMVAIPPGYASALWPPAGIALAACLAFGPRIWPGIFAGAVLANLGILGTPVLVALSIGAGNTCEAVIAGLMIRRFIKLRHRFDCAAAVWKFAAIAFAASMIAANNGVTTLAIAGQVPWAEFGTHWLTWWLGDATGIIIVTPLLLCWSEADNGRTAGERRIEYQLFAALLALCGALVLAVRFPASVTHTIAYLMIPLVTWAAARLDQRAVTAASLAISAIAVVDLLGGAPAMFSPLSLNESLILLQLFVSAVALTGLTLSSVAGEVVRMNTRLAASHAELERRVRERTEELERTAAQHRLLARRMVKIRDEEVRRLAADLHDGLAQDMTSLAVSLDLMRAEKSGKSAKWLDERLGEALVIVNRAGTALREAIGGLRLPGLDQLALVSALRRHAADFESRTGILVTVTALPGPDTVALQVKDALLRIFLETLANVARHADATAIRVTLESGLRRTRLVVDDNGRGFDTAARDTRGAQTHCGLQIMRERAAALGAKLHVHSAPGAGTRVECVLNKDRD